MAPSRTSNSEYDDLSVKTSQITLDENQLWEIKDIPGKGKGVVSTKDILPGTLLLSEAPIITTECIKSSPDDLDSTEHDLATTLAALPHNAQKAYRSLYNNHSVDDPSHPLVGILRSNGYPLGADADVGGIFPDISRINHSCNPNAVQYWNPLLDKQTIHAVRTIPAGAEILTLYSTNSGPSSERREILREQFKFDCACEVCSLPAEQQAESDARFQKAQELDAVITDAEKSYTKPDEVMRACREIFNIFEKENLKDGRLSRLYWDLFQLCNLQGDLARARCFAKYYLDAKKMAEGADSMNVLQVKMFIKSPQKHASYEPSGKWKTGTGDVPKGLGAKQFARWLWREDV